MPKTLTFALAVTQIIRRPAAIQQHAERDIAPPGGHWGHSKAAIQKLKGQAYLDGKQPRRVHTVEMGHYPLG